MKRVFKVKKTKSENPEEVRGGRSLLTRFLFCLLSKLIASLY